MDEEVFQQRKTTQEQHTAAASVFSDTSFSSVANIIELRSFHTQYVERMAMSCFVLDEELHQTAMKILQICLQCSQIVTMSARANRKENFASLKEQAIKLKENLSILLQRFTSMMECHRSREHFAPLVLSLRSL
tara:strand:+ start:117 stop:518 length:402 start_codon:yes stop_codon:yes gene_type:complete